LLFICAVGLLIACATIYAPEGRLPDTENAAEYVYGGWITIETEPDSQDREKEWMQYSGEFMAVDEFNVYVLYDSLYQIPKRKISNSILELDEKNTTVYGLWVLVGTLATISNGYYSTITAPLWLLFGIPTATGESFRDRYDVEYPTEEYWESVRKFARFPQGIENINLEEITEIADHYYE
jgi:hypothetical protein